MTALKLLSEAHPLVEWTTGKPFRHVESTRPLRVEHFWASDRVCLFGRMAFSFWQFLPKFPVVEQRILGCMEREGSERL